MILEKIDNIDREIVAQKKKALLRGLGRFDSLMVALSGGADSACLLALAAGRFERGCLLAVTFTSPLTAPGEVKSASAVAARLKVEHLILEPDLLRQKDIEENGPERCYHCKKRAFTLANKLASERGIEKVADGSNLNDGHSQRPGLRALNELGVISPLMEAGLDSAEVRFLAAELGLPNHNRPGESCLATRFPTGERLTLKKLEQVGGAESFLRSLGLKRELRVRCHGDLARIEAAREEEALIFENRERLLEELGRLGFSRVAIDLGGFVSGSMDKKASPPR